METITIENNKIDFRKIANDEPAWLYQLRLQGWQSYVDLPMPEQTNHLWRYTAPASFAVSNPEDAMQVLPESANPDIQDSSMIDPELAGSAATDMELGVIARLQPDIAKTGIIFEGLLTAVRKYPELIENYLGKLIPANFGKFEAANMALWSTGIFLYIPPYLSIEKPIYIHRQPTGLFSATRLLAIIGQNSQITLIDDFYGDFVQNGGLANNAIEIFAGESANVKYANIQRFGTKSKIYTNQRINLDRNAVGISVFASLGGALAKLNAGTILAGKGANSQMYGVAFGNNNQHLDHHTYHHHKAAATTSNINFKVVLRQKALSAYTGLIRIEKDAPNCEAYQENRNLLLNKGARAESIPELEILNDQVRCTHGATVGPLDPEMMFYIRSRGLTESQAVKELVAGFIQATLDKMPGNLGHIVGELVKAKMEECQGG